MTATAPIFEHNSLFQMMIREKMNYLEILASLPLRVAKNPALGNKIPKETFDRILTTMYDDFNPVTDHPLVMGILVEFKSGLDKVSEDDFRLAPTVALIWYIARLVVVTGLAPVVWRNEPTFEEELVEYSFGEYLDMSAEKYSQA